MASRISSPIVSRPRLPRNTSRHDASEARPPSVASAISPPSSAAVYGCGCIERNRIPLRANSKLPTPTHPEVRVAQRKWDAVVIGGGHNGLVTGFYLARRGLQTLILE